MNDISKSKRLSKVAKELNLGISTIVEFLNKKGHKIDPNPNNKISDELFSLLAAEFSTDIKIKKESEGIHIGSNRTKGKISIEDVNNTEQTEDEDEDEDEKPILIKDVSSREEEYKTKVPTPEIKIVGKIDLERKPKIPEPIVSKVDEPIQEQKIEQPQATPKQEEPIIKEELPINEIFATEKPENAEIKVVGMIDLNAINQKTRPDKKTKKQREAEQEIRKATVHRKEEVAKVEESTSIESKDKEPAITKIFRADVEKISGPTIVGKIELRNVQKEEEEESFDSKRKKKKRKRIKKDKELIPLEESKPEINSDKKVIKKIIKQPITGKKKFSKPEVDVEEVDKQVKDTLSKLSLKAKSKGAKYRKDKRELYTQRQQDEQLKIEEEKHILKVNEFVSANELATMMNVAINDVITTCMNMGLFVSINQRLDAETMSLVADEFGYTIEVVGIENENTVEEEVDAPEDLSPRPPIITVMGHVDHGKTRLLDYIRNANVVAGEAGGITQHIGAYNVTLDDGRKMTFLDTPGHEAFTAMRARGAKVTDIAIIIVAADDDVMPQTIEAINHATAANVPIVFAINKIDKPTANPDKIKDKLAAMNFLIEEWGGKYQSQDISAISGLNVKELLDKVLLEAELLELKANPNRNAIGTVLESALDKGRGYVATVLIENGTLRIGDIMLAGTYTGRVKAMYNERNQKIDVVGPACPVQIIGLNGAPQAGDRFNVMDNEREAREIANKREQLIREQGLRTRKHITLDEIGRRIAIGNFKQLNIVVKGDVDGSIEALSDSLIKLSNDEIVINIIHKAVGQISESDVMLATASNAVIIGFQVRPSASARRLAETEEIDIRLYSVIYHAINEVKDAMEGMLSPVIKEDIIATLEILEVFKIGKVGTIAGCIVRDGKLKRDSKVRVIRDGIVVFTGELGSLRRFKDDVKEVVSGNDCGLNIHNFNDIKVGDIVEGYTLTEVKKVL